jgi:catechol 2,3-dioxygenase-like lactoylglutathione lyase family enzyme
MLSLDAEADRNVSDRRLSPAKFAHAVFRTARYAAMLGFWKELLNARATFENEQVAFLSFDEEHHRVAFVNIPFLGDKPKLPLAGFDHLAFTYTRLGDLLSTYRRLKDAGILPIWCINHGPTTSIYYQDPDGNKAELQFDNLSVAGADAFMRGDYFAQNPIGVDFDPELLIERYLRGDAIDDLVRQGSAVPPPGVESPQPEEMIPYDRRGELLGSHSENAW